MKDKVLIIGSGAREQCLAWKLSKSPRVKDVYIFPGNGGNTFIGSLEASIPGCSLSDQKDFELVGNWCLVNNVSMVVVGPEVPLVEGFVDALKRKGISCFGPCSSAAMIEGSKRFAKEFMLRHSIPTARFKSFTDSKSACEFIRSASFRATVIKACGLAAGKGVVVAKNQDDAFTAVIQMLEEKKFGNAGCEILVEELLEGEEISVLCFCDGKHIAVMPPAQDHKRLLESDMGPNTGGMGAYCPCPQVSDETLTRIKKEILQKVVSGLNSEEKPYVGVLYAGLMLTEDGPKVLEFNCRFGDPECQVILPLLKSDLYEIMRNCIEQKLDSASIKWEADACAVGVVLASEGYPGFYEKGKEVTGIKNAKEEENVFLFHAGTKLDKSGSVITSGGRVLTIVARSDDCLATARSKAMNVAEKVRFQGSYHRKDIASRGIAHENRKRLTYSASGVSVSSGNEFVRRISPLTKLTLRSGCTSSIGGFGGLFDTSMAGYNHPVLVAGTDGVGTKLLVANACNTHSSIGIDLVAMCVNDILTHNAEPLFFLDYYACGRLSLDVARDVVKGIADGCVDAGCALIGGETAEMPGMYSSSSYDIAGFAVGAYEKHRDRSLPMLDEISPGDIIVGVASSGLHSNGFSLVRKIVDKSRLALNEQSPFDSTKSLGECLLTPTAIYCKLLPVLRSNRAIKSVAHITGGGLLENLPRALPAHLGAKLNADQWTIHSVFGWLFNEGDLEADEMLRTFNCGLGLCLVVDSASADHVIDQCRHVVDLDVGRVGDVVLKDGGKPVVVKNIKQAFKRSYAKVEKNNVTGSITSSIKKRVAVIISGNGSNLQSLIDHSTKLDCPYQVELVISNKSDAYGLIRAQKHGIATRFINSKSYPDRESFDRSLNEHLINHRIDFVCLAGFMKLLSGWFVKEWRGRVINVHPSLLPLFKGLHPHKQAIDAGVCLSGCSVHFVVEKMDAGPLIGQQSVSVFPDDSVKSLQERIKMAEHDLYPRVLCQLCEGRAILSDVEDKIKWI